MKNMFKNFWNRIKGWGWNILKTVITLIVVSALGYGIFLAPVLAAWVAGALLIYTLGCILGMVFKRKDFADLTNARNAAEPKNLPESAASGFTLIELIILIPFLIATVYLFVLSPIIAAYITAGILILIGGFMISVRTIKKDANVLHAELIVPTVQPAEQAPSPEPAVPAAEPTAN